MFSFEQLSPQSQIWIYQANRFFTAEEQKAIEPELATFAEGWAAHGSGLKAWAGVKHQLFIVLVVDQSQRAASGCSIDSSVHFLKELEQKYQIDLFQRTNVAYWDANDNIQLTEMGNVGALLAAGKINEQTILFNNMVQTKADLESHWQIPIAESWLSRVL